MHPKLILIQKGLWKLWNYDSDNEFMHTITEEQRAENKIGTLNSLTNEKKPIDTVTSWTDRRAESQVSINNTSNSSNPLKRKYTAGNKSIQSNSNAVRETQQEVSNDKQISSDMNTKPSTSGIAKTRMISKQKSESKKMEISETKLNTKADYKIEPNTYKRSQRNANNNKSYVEVNDNNGDFADSSASWAPSECDSDSDSQVKIKKMKITPRKQYTNCKMYESFKTEKCYFNTEYNFYIKNSQEIMNILNTMKGQKEKSDLNGFKEPIEVLKKCGNSPTDKDDKDENSPSDGSSKSDEHNVLKTNKYRNIKDIEKTSTERKELKRTKCENINGSQMVALGNGTTLIDKAIYDKINWTCYSKATRCLLKAVFPRSVLATHSLTGKPSPAFRDKQAKMCLDRKKVLDILNEVRDNFHVQENCIRSVITKTCADEGKVLRNRQIKKKENVPPTKKNSVNKPNTDT